MTPKRPPSEPLDLEFRLALRALQVLAVTSRCWTSRQAALLSLRVIGMCEAVPTDDRGLPEAVELADHERPDKSFPGSVGNFMHLWGP